MTKTEAITNFFLQLNPPEAARPAILRKFRGMSAKEIEADTIYLLGKVDEQRRAKAAEWNGRSVKTLVDKERMYLEFLISKGFLTVVDEIMQIPKV